MRIEEIQTAFARHMDEFRKEVDALGGDTPENRQKIEAAVKAVFKNNSEATGLGGALAQHWAPFIANMLSHVESEAKKEELMEASKRMLLEQVTEFSRILAAASRPLPANIFGNFIVASVWNRRVTESQQRAAFPHGGVRQAIRFGIIFSTDVRIENSSKHASFWQTQ